MIDTKDMQNAKDAQIVEKNRVDRKTVLVGLIIALLFIGGGIYAWQNSQLKGSIGKAVQTVYVGDVSENDGTEHGMEQSDPELQKKATPTVYREDIQVKRMSKQTITVVFPNGGEVFCMGEKFNIFWTLHKTEPVHIVLQSETAVYDLGNTLAKDGSPRQVVLPVAGNRYKVVVSTLGKPIAEDSSDGFFAITECTE